MLDEYRPKFIICACNVPFSSYTGMLLLHGMETLVERNHLGRPKLRATRSGKRTVIGVPHLSRYEVTESLLAFVTRVHKKGEDLRSE